MNKVLLTLLLFVAPAIGAAPERELIIKWRALPHRLDSDLFSPDVAVHVQSIRPALPVAGEMGALERITAIELCDTDAAEAVLAMLEADSRVEYAEQRQRRALDGSRIEPELRHAVDAPPDDPFYAQQWGLHRIEIESAWDMTSGAANAVIAVVDIGVDFTHPELSDRRWENEMEITGVAGVDDDGNGYVDDFFGFDFIENDGDPNPDPRNRDESHGTHVAGIAAATRNNGRGIAGTAPGCKIMGVRAGQSGSIAYGYEGIVYAWRSGAKVINCSWGGSSESQYERDVIDFVTSHGAVVVVSAGNGNTTGPHYPAALTQAVSVAATRWDDFAADFTHYGPWVKISAPGVAILSTYVTLDGQPGYDTWQGTSMAAPFVAGVCALVASRFPTLNAYQIAQRVIGSTDPIDHLNTLKAGGLGVGRVNAYRALVDSVPGIRIVDYSFEEISGNGDGRIRALEVADVRIRVTNDLGFVENVSASIATTEDTVVLQQPVALYGDMVSGGSYENETPFRVELPLESPRARVLPLSVDFRDGSGALLSRQMLTLYLDSTFVTARNANWNLGFAENGSFGYSDYRVNRYLGAGLTANGDLPLGLLYHGSFFFAAEGAVSDNFYGDSTLLRFDWEAMPDSLARWFPSDRASFEARAVFEDRGAEYPLFIRATASVLSWDDAAAGGCFILEYDCFNRGLNAYDSAYAGLFMDFDVGPPARNFSAYDLAGGIAFVRSTVENYPLVGIAGLESPLTVYRAIDNRAEIDLPADWSDARKFQLMREGIGMSYEAPLDISQLVGVGPFRIEGQSSRRVTFALLMGNNLHELQQQLAIARERYLPASPPQVSPAETQQFAVYPNPLPGGAALSIALPGETRADLVLYNLLGQEVRRLNGLQLTTGEITLSRIELGEASGLLFYGISASNKTHYGKILLLN